MSIWEGFIEKRVIMVFERLTNTCNSRHNTYLTLEIYIAMQLTQYK